MKNEKIWSEAYKKAIVKTTKESRKLPFLKFHENCMVLDIGCGEGIYLQNLVKEFAVRAFGIDVVSFESDKHAFIKADAQELPFRDSVFDVVYSLGVIEHLISTEKAISESFRVLKKDGQVLFTVPNMFSLHTFFDRPLRKLLRLWHLGLEKSFTVSELQNMLTKTGFKRVRYGFSLWNFSENESVISENYKKLDNLLSKFFDCWGFFICIFGRN